MTDIQFEIRQGEDWTADVVWTDSFDVPHPVVHPARMVIKGPGGQTLHTLLTNPDIPDGEIPSITTSQNLGLIQLHIPSTVSKNFDPGQYQFDLFATVDDAVSAPGPQSTFIFGGVFDAHQAITEF